VLSPSLDYWGVGLVLVKLLCEIGGVYPQKVQDFVEEHRTSDPSLYQGIYGCQE